MTHACCRWLILQKIVFLFLAQIYFLLPTDTVQSYESISSKSITLVFKFLLMVDSKVFKGNKRFKQSPPGGEAKILLFA